MKPALLIIDVQNQFLPYMAEQDKRIAPELINMAIAMFRERGAPVFRIYHTSSANGPQPGTPGFEYLDSLKVEPEDRQIVKNYPNSFKKTGLETRLRELGCDTLFLCGLSATGCVVATYFGAKELDFAAFLIKGTLISHNSALTDAVGEICDSVPLTALHLMLASK